MFLAIPLENRPSWSAPPWMTVLLIALNMLVYWGWQAGEEEALERATQRYVRTALPGIELPLYLRHLQAKAEGGTPRDRAHAKGAQALWNSQREAAHAKLYRDMRDEKAFRSALLSDAVIRPSDPAYAQWRAQRDKFTASEPEPFTERWARSYDRGDAWKHPHTLLTATFLHGSTGHLLGNMLFLFLFGFTLEMALGPWRYLACYLLGGVGASVVAETVYAGMGGLGLGASGAVSALMGMYAVLYRLRRIRFFTIVLFYFNYVRLPALVMLPAWMAHELLQHWMGGARVAYMAHLGGLLTGALAMALLMALHPVTAPATSAEKAAQPCDDDAEVRALAERAQAFAAGLKFEQACRAWGQVARLRPNSAPFAKAWFEAARHWPQAEDFHAAARLVFRLPGKDEATRRLQHGVYRTYLDQARPSARLSQGSMLRLARICIALHEWDDAQRLCRALNASADAQPPAQWADTLLQLASGLARAGQPGKALEWLPALQRHAPADALTHWLQAQQARQATA